MPFNVYGGWCMRTGNGWWWLMLSGSWWCLDCWLSVLLIVGSLTRFCDCRLVCFMLFRTMIYGEWRALVLSGMCHWVWVGHWVTEIKGEDEGVSSAGSFQRKDGDFAGTVWTFKIWYCFYFYGLINFVFGQYIYIKKNCWNYIFILKSSYF